MDCATREKLHEHLDEYHRIINEDDKDHSAWDQYGMILLELGSYANGKKAILKAVKLEPTNSNYWNNLGLAYDRLGKKELAMRLYSRALELSSGSYYPLHNLSLHLHKMGREKEAVNIWIWLTQIYPYEFHPFAYLAKHYFEKKEFEKVKEILEKRREQVYYNNDALWFIAQKYFQIGEFTIAKETLKILCKRDFEFYEFPLMLAQIYFLENDFENALYYYDQTIKLRPFDTELLYQKMILLAKLNHPAFISKLKESVQVNPNIAKQTLTDDIFSNYRQNPEYMEVISLARERYNFLSKPVFLLGEEFDGHPILKRLHSHRSLAIMYHYLYLLGFSNIFIYFISIKCKKII
ncbi:MAG: tetratricopeptide repeat protein [Candidatus Heimdallarchaeota archaeon]|nr:tetratricopeptide repeat protein [Candidatus Heimdallarchaeota archaeon]